MLPSAAPSISQCCCHRRRPILAPSQRIYSGVAGTLDPTDLDRLISLINSPCGSPDVLVTDTDGIEAYAAGCYAAGLAPQTVKHPFFPCSVLAHRGIPLLRDDGVATSATSPTVHYIYALTLGWGRGLVGLYPASTGMIEVERMAQAGNQATDPYDYEGYRVSFTYQLALFRQKAIARLDFVK